MDVYSSARLLRREGQNDEMFTSSSVRLRLRPNPLSFVARLPFPWIFVPWSNSVVNQILIRCRTRNLIPMTTVPQASMVVQRGTKRCGSYPDGTATNGPHTFGFPTNETSFWAKSKHVLPGPSLVFMMARGFPEFPSPRTILAASCTPHPPPHLLPLSAIFDLLTCGHLDIQACIRVLAMCLCLVIHWP